MGSDAHREKYPWPEACPQVCDSCGSALCCLDYVSPRQAYNRPSLAHLCNECRHLSPPFAKVKKKLDKQTKAERKRRKHLVAMYHRTHPKPRGGYSPEGPPLTKEDLKMLAPPPRNKTF